MSDTASSDPLVVIPLKTFWTKQLFQ